MTLLFLTLLLKSLLVFAVAGLLLLALRRSSAAARALVCLLTLGAVLLLPLFSLTLPGWHLPVLKTQEAEPISHQEPTPPRSSATLPKREGEEFQASQSPASPPAPRPPVSGGPLRSEERTQQGGGYFFYLLGLLLAAVRPLLGLWGIKRLSQTCVAITDTPTLALAESCAGLLGLRLPRLCRADVPVPMTWGWRRPVLALPPASADWPEDRLRSVLLHEMAHVKRRDWPAHRLADFACAVLWFHPFVWLTARRLRSETELACDGLVLASGIPAADYARHLLEIASALPRAHTRSHTAIAMAQTSHIESRLHMILDKTRTRRTLTRRVLLFSVAIGAAALVPLAMLRPAAKAQTAIAGAEPVQLLGIVDAVTPNGNAWGTNGKLLPAPVFSNDLEMNTKFTTQPGQKALFFVFHLPKSLQNTPLFYNVSGTTYNGFGITQMGHPPHQKMVLSTLTAQGVQMRSQIQSLNGITTYGVGFPTSLSRTNIRVGILSGIWKTALIIPAPFQGKYTVASASGSQYPSTELSLSSGKIRFNSQFSLDDFQELQLVAVDKKGRHSLLHPTIEISRDGRQQTTVHLPQPLSRLRDIQVQTRPFAWTEFKNVALQPVK